MRDHSPDNEYHSFAPVAFVSTDASSMIGIYILLPFPRRMRTLSSCSYIQALLWKNRGPSFTLLTQNQGIIRTGHWLFWNRSQSTSFEFWTLNFWSFSQVLLSINCFLNHWKKPFMPPFYWTRRIYKTVQIIIPGFCERNLWPTFVVSGW